MSTHQKSNPGSIPVIWKIIIAVVITATISGGGVYLWQRTTAENEKDRLEYKICKLRDQIALLERTIERLSEESYQTEELSRFSEERSELNAEINLLRGKVHYMQNELLAQSKQEPLFFYLDRLRDSNFTSTYGHGYTLYVAAEELSNNIGKPAIPYLIRKLETEEDYERTQVLYALRLAAQHENVKVFTHGEFPTGGHNLAFPRPASHPDLVKAWNSWWEKYRNHWED